MTYYVLSFIHLETRRVSLVGFTPYPDQDWMEHQARNLTMEQWGCLRGSRYLLHDRDTKFGESFRELIESGSVKPIRLPARSPNFELVCRTLGEISQRNAWQSSHKSRRDSGRWAHNKHIC
jgi:hypothetical protein